MKNMLLNLFIAIFITLSLNSCTAEKVEVIQFVIPPAPEEPRIMHLKTYRGESTFSEKSKLDELIGGESSFAGKDFLKPFGIVAHAGKFYVTDTGMGAVFVMDTIKRTTSFLGHEGPGKLQLPVGIALDENENVYVADSKSQKVFGYDKTGQAFFSLGDDGEFIRPTGLAINKELQIMYVVDTKGHIIRAFSLNGDFLFDIGERGTEEGQFNFPTSITVDQYSGNVIVVDTQNFRVQIFNQDGEFIHTFGNIGDKPGTFSRPKGVATDSEGNIYISDSAFDNIQIFDKTGTQLLMYFGSAGYNPGQFQMPASLAFDENDKLHVTENFSGKVQVFQYLSKKWKKKSPLEYKELMNSRIIPE